MKSIKIILLAPVVFDRYNQDLVEEVMLKLDNRKKDISFSAEEWEYLDGENGYLTNIDGIVDIKDAISRERNLNPQMYTKVINSISQEYKTSLLNINCNLIVNEQHSFLMLFEFHFTNLDFNDCNTFLTDLMSNRNLFKKTNTVDFYNETKIKSMIIINDIIKKILNNDTLLLSEKNFTIDSNYPLIFINGFNKNNDLSKLFSFEEDIEQRNSFALITQDYENSFVHIGWNYGIIKDVPKNVSQKYLCMLIFLQLTYYSLRFYKNYFQKKIQTLSNQHTFNEEDIKNFDILKILYHKKYLSYKTYKSGLFPKYYREFTNIEILWHIEEDISFIEKTFDVQNEYINKHFQLKTDKTNRNLNYGIAVIGLIQIFTIYGVFNDYVSLKKDVDYSQYLNYATMSIIATMTILILFVGFVYITGKRKK